MSEFQFQIECKTAKRVDFNLMKKDIKKRDAHTKLKLTV